MKKFLFFIVSLVFLTLPFISFTQTIPVNDNALGKSYAFIHPSSNNISNSNKLDSFYRKLYNVETTGQGVVSIVHIGDSHIQADFLTTVVRTRLQQFFGNAGRGLVFPYQLAQSNAPQDIASSSYTNWQFNRIAHPEIDITPGISGYSIQTNADNASIRVSLKTGDSGPQNFTRLKFFLDSNQNISWILKAQSGSDSFEVKRKEDETTLFDEVVLAEAADGFVLTTKEPGQKCFYGVSLENPGAGILYHSIGVNGARYDQYNLASLFWKQLPALHADLFIISLGTNDAQALVFNEGNFQDQLSRFLQNLRATAPGAAILITTTADSYKGKKPNKVLKQINVSLSNYCNQHSLPLWDLYRITSGNGSAANWVRKRLMNRDRIHFTAEGYRIQGSLLFNALAKGYNNCVNNH